MAFDFRFPDVGEGTAEGTLVKWLVKEGDFVKADQNIAEIETDKAVVEIPSPKEGKILKLFGKPGDLIKVGSVLATIGDKGETAGVPLSAGSSSYSSKEQVKEKGKVEKEKINSAGVPAVGVSAKTVSGKVGTVLATPATRKLARELGVDIAMVSGSGLNGRITDEDVKNASSGGIRQTQSSGTLMAEPTPSPVSVESPKSPLAHHPGKQSWKTEGSEERIPLKGIRKTIADRLTKSMFTAVQVTHMDECDVTALVKLKEKEKKKMESRGIRLTYLAFVAKACASALQNHPSLNASIDDSSDELVFKKYYNIGIAVDTEDGLMVPVLRNADKKSIRGLAEEMQALAEKARQRKIAIDDLKGSTFTITNVGSLGGTYSTPVINWPDSAILGLGKIEEKPVVRDGKIVPRHILRLSLTFDHRIIDGAQAVRFLNDVIQLLEDPALFLIDGM